MGVSMKVFICFALSSVIHAAFAQQEHMISFASRQNEIAIAIQNEIPADEEGIVVKIGRSPSWVRFEKEQIVLGALEAGSSLSARFFFSLDKRAPVGIPSAIGLVIVDREGREWRKEIGIVVGPPDRFELFQNYPNPANPGTIISYQLPAAGKVTLEVYDLLGRLVETLVDEGERPAGFHEEKWDASGVAGGMYVYRLRGTTGSGKKVVEQKRMIVLK